MTEKIYDYPLAFSGDLTLSEIVDIEERLSDWDVSIFIGTMEYNADTNKAIIKAQGRELADAQVIVDMIDGVEIDEETLREWISDENVEVAR